jgi:ArsR family transcriptional regulator
MLNYSSPSESALLLGALKALSQPTRLRIFDMLMGGVQCSCEISERLALAPNLVSYHMRALEDAGLVQSERDVHDARWIYYSLRPAMLEQLHNQLCELANPRRLQPRMPNCGPRAGCRTDGCP